MSPNGNGLMLHDEEGKTYICMFMFFFFLVYIYNIYKHKIQY